MEQDVVIPYDLSADNHHLGDDPMRLSMPRLVIAPDDTTPTMSLSLSLPLSLRRPSSVLQWEWRDKRIYPFNDNGFSADPADIISDYTAATHYHGQELAPVLSF